MNMLKAVVAVAVVTATPVAAESVEGAQAQAPEQIKTPTTQGNVKLTAIRV
jgi:hypothetical protein